VSGGSRGILWWASGASLVALVAVIAAIVGMQPMAPLPVTRLAISLPQELTLTSQFAVSSDGRQVVFVARSADGIARLHLRALDRFESVPITGTEGAAEPFFSADDGWIGYQAAGEIRKCRVEGGASITITPRSMHFGAAWAPDDTILFSSGPGSGILRISASGGEVQALTSPDLELGEVSHGRPQPLDGDHVLFTIGTGEASHVNVLSLTSGESRRLLEDAAGARYLSTGHLVYSKDGTLMVVPFDVERLVTTGSPRPVLEGLAWENVGGLQTARFAVSSAGSLYYVAGWNIDHGNSLVLVDRNGSATTIAESSAARSSIAYFHPRVSPDGARVAVSGIDRSTGIGDIWIMDLERGSQQRLTIDGANYTPIWTPDAERIAYVARGNIAWTAADGSGAPEPLLVNNIYERPTSFSPDGKLLAFTSETADGGDIGVLAMEDRSVTMLSAPFQEKAPMFSPDGGLLAYTSNRSGRDEIYVRVYPGEGREWPISTDGGRYSAWSADGRQLLYRSGDRILAVDVTTDADRRFGKPQLLFEGPFHTQDWVPNFDPTPDGKRFVMVQFDQSKRNDGRISIVQGWLQELGAAD